MNYNFSNQDQFQKAELPDCYLYISHLEEDFKFWILPQYPDTINDSMSSNFASNSALGRSAPVWTYSNSGPRSVQITLSLYREMMDAYNVGRSNSKLLTDERGIVKEDYVDNLIHAIQSIAVPKYNLSNKMVEPPLVAVRLGQEVFIKGIVNGAIGVTYKKPLLYNNKYACVDLSFTVTEVDPYDATEVFNNGSFRGVVRTLRSGMNMEEGD